MVRQARLEMALAGRRGPRGRVRKQTRTCGRLQQLAGSRLVTADAQELRCDVQVRKD